MRNSYIGSGIEGVAGHFGVNGVGLRLVERGLRKQPRRIRRRMAGLGIAGKVVLEI